MKHTYKTPTSTILELQPLTLLAKSFDTGTDESFAHKKKPEATKAHPFEKKNNALWTE